MGWQPRVGGFVWVDIGEWRWVGGNGPDVEIPTIIMYESFSPEKYWITKILNMCLILRFQAGTI